MLKKQLIEKANQENNIYPLSYGQKALFFMYLNSPESSAYNVGFTVRIVSEINITAFQKALQKLINRHPALRTNYFVREGVPVQEVHGYKEASFEIIDCAGIDENVLKEKVLQTNRTTFDLEKGNVFKTYLFKFSENNSVLLISMHHISSDGFSMSILLDELKNLYEAEVDGTQINLPQLNYKYSDYIKSEEEFVKSEKGEVQCEYWLKELGGELPALNLPTDKPRPPMQTFDGAVEYFNLDQDLVEKLKSLSKTEGTTLFVTLLTSFQIFLHRYTGQEEVITGVPTAGRNNTEFEKIIGYFINPVAIRSDFSEDISFTDYLSKVKRKVLGAISNQDFPFALIVEKMHQKRDPSRSAVFQNFFGLQKITGNDAIQEMIVPGNKNARAQWGKFLLEPYEITQQEGQFEVTLEFVEGKDLFSGAFKYNTDLFSERTIKQMIIHFKNLLNDIVSNPVKKNSELILLTVDEKDLIINKWNNTNHRYKEFECLHKLFEKQVQSTPDNIAVIFEGKQLTYSDLNKRSNQLANYLIKRGIGPDKLAGLCVERSIEMVVGILAVLKAGGAYIPIDPDYPQSRIEFMISDSNAKVLITQKSLAQNLPENNSKIILIDDDLSNISKEDENNFENNTQLDNLAYVIYTSGSTGIPKGVMISHASIVNHMLWMKEVFGFDSSDSVFQKTPFSFDASVWEFYLPLITGGRLIIAKPEGHLDMAYLVGTIFKNDISIIQLVPSLLRMLLSEKGIENCTSLKTVFCGGEALTYELQEKLFSKLSVGFYNLYGPTEATIDATYFKCEGKYESKYFPVGKPVYNARAYILDKYLNPVPAGVAGELYLGGINIARGYLNNESLTKEKFIDDIFENNGKKLYKTGDLAKYSKDGNIEFIGRADHQVKLRGFRIELEEIEAKLVTHKKIKEAVVIVREDKPGVQRLTAYIVLRDNEKETELDLKEYLRSSLPEYMVPADIVVLDKMPLTPNLKIDRSALPVPGISLTGSDNYAPPVLPQEIILANIWRDVLGIDKVGINDNFFQLGGDSIISIQIISRANQHGMKITPKQIFRYQTIAGLASVAEIENRSIIEQGIVTGEIPLTPVQHWFFKQNLPEPNHYNHSVLLKVPKDLNNENLKKAFTELIKHHDALRLTFEKVNSGWKQMNDDFKEVDFFSVLDLSVHNSESVKEIMSNDIEEIQITLSFSNGVLLKAKLYRTNEESEDRLLIIMHHLCVDGISWRILLEDLHNIYHQLSVSEDVKLPSKTNSYKDWSCKLTEYSKSEELLKEKDYWFSINDEAVKPIPVDFPENDNLNTVESSDTVTTELSEQETQTLLKEVPNVYNTHINEILLTALILSYRKWSNENKLLLNLEGHGREELFDQIDISRTTGWFTSIYPVVLKSYNYDDTGEAVKVVKENIRQIPNNGIGYGVLRYLSDDKSIVQKLKALSNPEIIFNYLGQINENISSGSDWKLGKKSLILHQDKKGIRNNLLELNSLIINGRLKMDFVYSTNIHKKETIENFANLYINELKNIISHCTSADNVGYTPSDFSASGLNQQELDNLLANIN